jgi:hypothetical protein
MANVQQHPQEPASTLAFESTPWLAADRTVEEPRRAPEPPMRLANDEHVIELQESESIRRER